MWNAVQLGLSIDTITAAKESVFGVFLVRIQSEWEKIQTRKNPNMDTFLHSVFFEKVYSFVIMTDNSNSVRKGLK